VFEIWKEVSLIYMTAVGGRVSMCGSKIDGYTWAFLGNGQFSLSARVRGASPQHAATAPNPFRVTCLFSLSLFLVHVTFSAQIRSRPFLA
jgi:hypothetical protein